MANTHLLVTNKKLILNLTRRSRQRVDQTWTWRRRLIKLIRSSTTKGTKVQTTNKGTKPSSRKRWEPTNSMNSSTWLTRIWTKSWSRSRCRETTMSMNQGVTILPSSSSRTAMERRSSKSRPDNQRTTAMKRSSCSNSSSLPPTKLLMKAERTTPSKELGKRPRSKKLRDTWWARRAPKFRTFKTWALL